MPLNNPIGYTGRGATFLVAANDASARSKAQADYVCDGTADDVEIQAAIAALPAGGGRVQLSEGNFSTTAAITMPGGRSGIHVAGMGERATYIKPVTNNIDAIQMGDNVTVSEGFSVRDLAVYNGIAMVGGFAINARKVNLSSIDHVRIEGCYYGIQVLSCVDLFMTNAVVRDMAAAGGIGIFIDGTIAIPSNNIFMLNVFIDRVSAGDALAGLYITCVDGLWWANGLIGHCTLGLAVNAGAVTSGTLCEYMMFTNVYSDYSGAAALILQSVAAQIMKSLTFTACHFSGGSGVGVQTTGAGIIDGVKFVGCEILSNSSEGFLHQSGGHVDMDACHLAGNSVGASGTKDAISVAAGLNDFTIRNCRIKPHAQFGNTQRYGINVLAGASDRYIIQGNDLQGNATGGLSDNGTGANRIVAHNRGYNPVGSLGPPGVPATTVAYTNAYGVDCTVHIAGGTVTVIAVGGVATGLIAGTFRVPAGGTITITYTGVPTWTWFGD